MYICSCVGKTTFSVGHKISTQDSCSSQALLVSVSINLRCYGTTIFLYQLDCLLFQLEWVHLDTPLPKHRHALSNSQRIELKSDGFLGLLNSNDLLLSSQDQHSPYIMYFIYGYHSWSHGPNFLPDRTK